jgi:hypothetical protein
MKYLFTILLLLSVSKLFAQVDTLVISEFYDGNKYSQDSVSFPFKKFLRNYNYSKLYLLPYYFTIFNTKGEFQGSSRKEKRQAIQIRKLIDERLSHVKVLFIENPTTWKTEDRRDSTGKYLGGVEYDTTNLLIYSINFKKMTSLQEVCLVGDDSDPIMDMPNSFYNSPAKKIYCYHLSLMEFFNANVRKKNKNIDIISTTTDDWILLRRILYSDYMDYSRP